MSTPTEDCMEQVYNTITWTEIPVLDLNRAKEFYTRIFGWSFEVPPMMDSCDQVTGAPPMLLFTHKNMHGSMFQVPKENFLSPADGNDTQKSTTRPVLHVKSIDEMLPLIEKAGGKVWRPKNQLPADMGATAYFLDTERNVIGLFSMK